MAIFEYSCKSSILNLIIFNLFAQIWYKIFRLNNFIFNFKAIFSCKEKYFLRCYAIQSDSYEIVFYFPDIFMSRCCVIRSSVTSVNGNKCNAVVHGCRQSLSATAVRQLWQKYHFASKVILYSIIWLIVCVAFVQNSYQTRNLMESVCFFLTTDFCQFTSGIFIETLASSLKWL